jgi:hypothetical protein
VWSDTTSAHGGDCLGRRARVAKQVSQQSERGTDIAALLDNEVEIVALVIDSAPSMDVRVPPIFPAISSRRQRAEGGALRR